MIMQPLCCRCANVFHHHPTFLRLNQRQETQGFWCPRVSAVEINMNFSELNFFFLPGIWDGNGAKILLQPVQPRSTCLLQLRRRFWFANLCVPTGFLTRGHTWLHTNRPSLQHLRDYETFRGWVSVPLCDVVWIIKCILTCKSGLEQAFSWPLRRLGWAPEIPPLIWHDLIWRISVLLLLSDVWTHMRGVRLREVFPELLWELMWDNSGPCLERKRGRSKARGGRREHQTEKEVNNMSDRKEWKGKKKKQAMEEMWIQPLKAQFGVWAV